MVEANGEIEAPTFDLPSVVPPEVLDQVSISVHSSLSHTDEANEDCKDNRTCSDVLRQNLSRKIAPFV